MAETTRRLPPDRSQRLVDFARACRGAVRAVSLYPPGHRAVDDGIARVLDAGRRATAKHSLRIEVMPNELRIGGLGPDRVDPAVRELASMLHAQQIGGLTLHGTADGSSWETLLGLMSRSAEENRRDGGLASLWATAGGRSIELHAIDYAALLREGHGGSLASLLKAAEGALAGVSLKDLESIITAVEERQSEQSGIDPEEASRAIARLATLVLERGKEDPARVEAALRRLAQLTSGLTAAGMCGLLAARAGHAGGEGTQAEAPGAGAVIDRMDVRAKARFTATALTTEGSATEPLREAFEALVPADERRPVGALADEMLTASAAPPDEVLDLRQELARLVASDGSGSPASSELLEIASAAGRAEDLETAKPDPAERMAQWTSTVTDTALRALDLQVLVDLLAIDQETTQFAAIAEQAAARIEGLLRVGFIDPALALEGALVAARERGGPCGEAAEAALATLRTGAVVREVLAVVRRTPEETDRMRALIARLGPAMAPPLATSLAHESDPGPREWLRSVLAGFGNAGEQAIRALLSSERPEIRRKAALLLRDFGGAASVDVLETLLGDSDPRVRREALRALATVEDPEAHERILRAIESLAANAQRALLDELGLVRDVRVSPLLASLAMRWRERRLSDAAFRAIGLLGGLGPAVNPESVEALAKLLDVTRWWSPRRARAVRTQAADALAAIGTPEARAALEAAVARRGKGAGVARLALARRQT
ncbi:MAG TPA: HEAT repeat domain-containing protein [Vicinamibacterales bacterium]|nr:HEAT repeat domain-containing protein [Vicinamibacterales bacterium]